MPVAIAPRPPHAVMLAVWKALFLREMLQRLSQDRLSWLWLVLEPLAHIIILTWLFTAGVRSRVVAGADVIVFITLGILGFFMLRNIMNRGMDAVEGGYNLYAFRQIKPVDIVFVRAMTAGFIECLIFVAMFAGAAVLDHPITPADPFAALLALIALWLLGLGLALAFSVPAALVPEFGRVVRVLTMPLYFFSGVIFPVSKMPVFLQDYLLFNPILHALEALRHAFMPTYQVPQGVNLFYPYACAFPLILIGLALHLRFRATLMIR